MVEEVSPSTSDSTKRSIVNAIETEHIFRTAAEHCGVVGASAALSGRMSPLLPITYGLAEHSFHSAAMSPQHRFRMSCLSKPLICGVVLESLSRNGIPLNEPICVRFPNVFGKARFLDQSISFSHLLSYSGGFDETKNWQYFHHVDQLSELPSALAHVKQLCPPGAHYMYSSLTIVIFAYILEELHTKPWEKILYDQMLELACVPPEAFRPGGSHDKLAGSRHNTSISADQAPPEYQLHIPLFQKIAAPCNLQLTPTELCRAGQRLLEIITPLQSRSGCSDQQSLAFDHQYIDGASFGLFHYHNGSLGFWSNGNGQNSLLMINLGERLILTVSTTSFPETIFFDELSQGIFGASFIKGPCLPRFELAACKGVYVAEGLQIAIEKVGSDFRAQLYYTPMTGGGTSISGVVKHTGQGDYVITRPGGHAPLERLAFLGSEQQSAAPQFARYGIMMCKRIRTPSMM